MPDSVEPVDAFSCSRCGAINALPPLAEPDAPFPCDSCGAVLGAFSKLDQQRKDRIWILTGGRPQTYKRES
jgi:hypothetical protein